MDVVMLLGAAGLGALLLKQLRQRPRRPLELEESFDVALHVARHEAKARGRALQPVDLLYGLVLEDDFRAAATRLGADVDAIEKCVFAALDEPKSDLNTIEGIQRQLFATTARGRRARCADLFWALYRSEPLTKTACAAGGIDALDLVFVLVHGYAEKELRPPIEGDVAVVLLNDDFSTMEIVTEILETQFGLEPAAAHEIMMRVHASGRGVVGRYGLPEAKELARKALALARSRGYPLAIRLDA